MASDTAKHLRAKAQHHKELATRPWLSWPSAWRLKPTSESRREILRARLLLLFKKPRSAAPHLNGGCFPRVFIGYRKLHGIFRRLCGDIDPEEDVIVRRQEVATEVFHRSPPDYF
jgi:hypothetical protein